MPPHITEVDRGPKLVSRMEEANSISDWSKILQDYISFGNNKIADTVGIFNFNSAHDCPNRETENCQVPWESCYAGRAERNYPQSLPYRRRQEYLWDSIDPETFAKAFIKVLDRKIQYGNGESYQQYDLRFSEAGDFRHNSDIIRADKVAEILSEYGISVYTYSASNYLDWSLAQHFTVNASNELSEYGDRRYMAFTDELPDEYVWCPHDKQKLEGVDPDDAIKCGDCRLCINPEGPDVGIPLSQ